MLSTTPPPVKLQSRVYAVLAATKVWTRCATGQLRKQSSLPSIMTAEGLELKYGSVFGTYPLRCRMAIELFFRSQSKICTS